MKKIFYYSIIIFLSFVINSPAKEKTREEILEDEKQSIIDHCNELKSKSRTTILGNGTTYGVPYTVKKIIEYECLQLTPNGDYYQKVYFWKNKGGNVSDPQVEHYIFKEKIVQERKVTGSKVKKQKEEPYKSYRVKFIDPEPVDTIKEETLYEVEKEIRKKEIVEPKPGWKKIRELNRTQTPIKKKGN